MCAECFKLFMFLSGVILGSVIGKVMAIVVNNHERKKK